MNERSPTRFQTARFFTVAAALGLLPLFQASMAHAQSTTAPHPGGASFKNSISLDQFAAGHLGRQTRFPSLFLGTRGSQSLSWIRAGVPIPATSRASEVFRKVFLTGTRDEVDRRILKLRTGQSIMDNVLDQAMSIRRRLDGESIVPPFPSVTEGYHTVSGHLYTTGRDGISIHGADASIIATIPVPEIPANMTFGGADGRPLFITARTGLYAVEMNVPGDGFGENR